MMKGFFSKNLSAERLSQHIFYVLLGLIVVVFALFYLVGFNAPFIDDPSFNAPLFTDVVMALMFLLTVGTLALTVWSLARGVKKAGAEQSNDNNIPVKRITYGVLFFTLILIAVTFLLGSPDEMLINGKPYNDIFWLKTADMFIWTTIILLVIAIGATIFGATRYYRKSVRQ